MSPDEVIVLYAYFAVGGVALAAAFGFAWNRARRRVYQLEAQLSVREPVEPPHLVAEIDELRQRLELLDEQIGRVADGQEFLARLVADRHAAPPVREIDRPRMTTPH